MVNELVWLDWSNVKNRTLFWAVCCVGFKIIHSYELHLVYFICFINSLWPIDTLWWQKSGSTGNGLLPDGTKPLSEAMLTYHQQGPVIFIQGQVHKKYLSSVTKISLNIIYLKFRSNLPGANEWDSHMYAGSAGLGGCCYDIPIHIQIWFHINNDLIVNVLLLVGNDLTVCSLLMCSPLYLQTTSQVSLLM